MKTKMYSTVFAVLSVGLVYAQENSVAKYDPRMAVQAAIVDTNGIKWIDGKYLPIEGRCFDNTSAYYDRLPSNVTAKVNAGVRSMKSHSAGLQFRFSTDSRKLHFKWKPKNARLAMDHMPSTGVSGIDIYRQSANGKWKFYAQGRITDGVKGGSLTLGWNPGTPCLVNLPLYNGIKEFTLGIDKNAKIEALPPRRSGVDKPVVFYGTSITHGGCASRPGLAFPSIVGRNLDVPIVNLGFSGSGRMEFEMSEHLAAIDASCYVLDCLWNMGSIRKNDKSDLDIKDVKRGPDAVVRARYEPFIRNLRAKRPGVPIVMAEQCDVYCREPNAKDKFIRGLYEKLIAEGWKNLVYLPKTEMYTGDLEGTVDGCHPNDHGMISMSKAFGKAVREALDIKYNVRNFGAKGDGVAKDTVAVQRAIDAASSAGGGEVLLPAGTYLCGSVFLKSGVDFHLAEGAVLKGSPDPADYNAADVAPQNYGRLGVGDNTSGGHLILCIEQENVTLRGPGKIDGNVGAFLKMPDGTHPEHKLKIPWRPSQMVWFVESKGISIRDIEMADAPYWSCFIYGCEDVAVKNAYIHTVRDPHTYNGDGLDIDSSRHVRVSDCRIFTADDSITLRASGARLKRDGDCADVVVSNCTFSSDCNAIRLGVGNGHIRDCSFHNIKIVDTRYAVNAVGAWSRPERGVDISRILFENFDIEAKGFCKFYYRKATGSVFDGLHFKHVRGKVKAESIFDDTPERPFRNLRFEDVKIEGETSRRVLQGN